MMKRVEDAQASLARGVEDLAHVENAVVGLANLGQEDPQA